MTPFDAMACLAMLLAFYPVPSPAALRQARAERPEYFAAATLIGRSGDKMQLPDGRIFDVIFAVEGPFPPRAWQMLDVTNAEPGDGDPFALEPGPLVPLDDEVAFPAPVPGEFVNLVAEELAAFGASDAVLEHAATLVLEFDGGAALDADFDREVAPALEHHVGFRAALDGDDIADEMSITHAAGGTINHARGEYDEDPPADIDEPDPGHEPPGGRDPDGNPIPPQN